VKNCTLTRKKYGPVTAIAWWDEQHEEPIYLVTNFISASKACDYYQKRFIIETFYSDQKSRGFNIDKSHLSSPQRLMRLSFAAGLAYLYVFFLGMLAMKPHYVKTILRKQRCDLSLFQLGLRLLHYLAVRGLPLPTSLCEFLTSNSYAPNWGDENYFEIGLKIHLNFCSAERFQVSAWVPRAKALALPVCDRQIASLHGQASLRPWHPVT
jgi:hypothetical protein